MDVIPGRFTMWPDYMYLVILILFTYLEIVDKPQDFMVTLIYFPDVINIYLIYNTLCFENNCSSVIQ